ncbi:histone-lysine N-methyltransferase SETD1B isoform X3 [Drosophila takahashii]|uniref:histone-lysine N-methyltransferase SETD1B isoform X3 n=1 Tax=Drosophila takahashii TaxID=29030 RepID=UPI001CF80A83|nr:uncharacterized protein LOC108060089 isoform X3 [Drosophila takahashii]
MPEPLGLLFSVPETKAKAPIIKVSCGIGDTDGYPAFDVDSEAYATKDDSRWGFLITGGAEFHMPLTVFQVTPNGLADKAGVRLGDIILQINEEDASQLTLSQAHEKINSTPKKIHFLLRNMEEDDPMGQFEAGEEKSIVMRVPKPLPPPSGRIRASSIEMRLLEMQRKLSAIAEIPKILCSTLATVSQSFGRLSDSELDEDEEAYVQRKFSYDEDALDFELRSGEQAGDTESDEEDDLVQVQEEEDEPLDVPKGGKQSKLLKDVTPESDYASETNYPANEASDDTESDDEEKEQEPASTVYFMKLPAAPAEEAYSSTEDEDDSDFLSTTYTWNLRNVPKLRINDAEAEGELPVGHQAKEAPQAEQLREKEPYLKPEPPKVRPATPTPQAPSQESAEGQTQKLLFRLDKLERSWPWADREKIIYKQSTCHLVPRKPLGLVGQRMQLLLKDKKE